MSSIPNHLMKDSSTGHLLKERSNLSNRNLVKDCYGCINCGECCFSSNSIIVLEWDYQLCVWPNRTCDGLVVGFASDHSIVKVPAGTILKLKRHGADPGVCDGVIWATEEKIAVEIESSTSSACGDSEVIQAYAAVMKDCDEVGEWYIGLFDSDLPADMACDSVGWLEHFTILKGVDFRLGDCCGGSDVQGDKETCTTTGPSGSERQYELWDIEVQNNLCCKDYTFRGTAWPNCDSSVTWPDEEECPCIGTTAEDENCCTTCEADDCTLP